MLAVEVHEGFSADSIEDMQKNLSIVTTQGTKCLVVCGLCRQVVLV